MSTSKFASTFVLFFAIGTISSAWANGGKGKDQHYSATERFGEGTVEFWIRIETVLFSITSVQNKYKVIHVRIFSKSEKPLQLSVDNDAMEVVIGGKKVAGILDISKTDPAFWDGLTAEMRKSLAYPLNVPLREEESIFVFVPKDAAENLPEAFRYKIASLPSEVVIKPPRATAAKL
jgi:hypothetical protein